MERQKLIEFLYHSNLVSISKAQEIAEHFSKKEFAKNDWVLKEGEVSDEYIFLEKGSETNICDQ
jgi:hypothetical protein